MKDLTITTIQSYLHWEDKEQNLKMFQKLIENISEETDLILLPEMFSTGFTMNNKLLAEDMNGNTVQWMKELAKLKNSAIAGSIIIEEDGKYFNRIIWVDAEGSIQYYNKRHLFSLGDENKHFTAGDKKLIVEYKGWKLNLNICYDLRFPVWSRNDKNNPYDVLIYLASWPEKRIEHWDTLLKARAIENQCYVVGVNRIGEDGNEFKYVGHTLVVHPFGNVLYNSNEAEVNTIVLSKHELELNRRQFPFLKDAD